MVLPVKSNCCRFLANSSPFKLVTSLYVKLAVVNLAKLACVSGTAGPSSCCKLVCKFLSGNQVAKSGSDCARVGALPETSAAAIFWGDVATTVASAAVAKKTVTCFRLMSYYPIFLSYSTVKGTKALLYRIASHFTILYKG